MDHSELLPLLARKLEQAAPQRLCVAYSGGGDSTALLHALAQLSMARQRELRALHVDHGLHAASSQWSEQCRLFCSTLAVPLEIIRVEVSRARGDGIEAAARHERYSAFAGAMHPGEWLALAHHRDDQIETVLLKWLRGAGPHGLGGMREQRAVGTGMLWRPLLDAPRSVLREYAVKCGLDFIDDPSNSDTRLARNYLRAEIVPRLLRLSPHAAESITHSAALCRETAAFLDAQADQSLARLCGANGTLDAHGWSTLPDALRMLVMEHWLHEQGLGAPPPSRCAELRRQIQHARGDREPCIVWPEGEVHVWRGALHAVPALAPIPQDWQLPWTGAPLTLPGDAGELSLRDERGEISSQPLSATLRVCFRRGGERIKPMGDPHTRELRDLFQRTGVPPWRRSRVPMIFHDHELLAVGNLWISDAGKKLFAATGANLTWQCQP